jgi:hypothetical protein
MQSGHRRRALAGIPGNPLTNTGDRRPEGEDSRQTPFLAVLRYVFGFLLLLGVLAFAAAWLLRR